MWHIQSYLTCSISTGTIYVTLIMTRRFLTNHTRQGGATECPTDWDSLSSQEQIDAVEEDDGILHCLCAHQDSGLLALDPSNVCYEYVRVRLVYRGGI